jgi:hypothetical protein
VRLTTSGPVDLTWLPSVYVKGDGFDRLQLSQLPVSDTSNQYPMVLKVVKIFCIPCRRFEKDSGNCDAL